jgi:hypothetical protein
LLVDDDICKCSYIGDQRGKRFLFPPQALSEAAPKRALEASFEHYRLCTAGREHPVQTPRAKV